MTAQPWTLWGIDLSYFTGKLEAILRAKGMAYERRAITPQNWPKLAAKVGVQHMPYLELPNGDFLSDTTLILRYLEDRAEGPPLSPAPGAARFMARLIEDWGDEGLWRPAMYYRWRVPESKHMQARRIIEQMKIDLPLPFWLKKRAVIHRQYGTYVKADGVRDAATRAATEQLYLNLLDDLNAIFERRPFLLGDRPTDADFGLFGPFFRHFFGDPVPGPLMQDRAPYVLLWAARLWAIKPADFAGKPIIDTVPDDLGPIVGHITQAYLPYLRANAHAVAAGEKQTVSRSYGVQWTEFTKPFRLWCLADLQDQFAALDGAGQGTVTALLGDTAIEALTAPLPVPPVAPPALPIRVKGAKPVDSWMRA